MRIAFFSPMPPSKSGIADYSAALVDSLSRLAEVQVFEGGGGDIDFSSFNAAIYQIGNNPFHAGAYESALRHPGFVVLHEANLHHLIADLTIRRGDWDAYVEECVYSGGDAALGRARRVREQEVGPDYEGVPMLRRILESARGVIVHSRFVESAVREAGYPGPVSIIPHGAWVPEVDGRAYRERLGVGEDDVLAGVFGFLKPYKRIAESLRAFQRLAKLHKNVKLILAGEAHPELHLSSLIRSLDLEDRVRAPGYTPIEDFAGYIAACDIVLNLRFPTVGESSGTLLRALGLGRATIVSRIGSFLEYPDDVCLKAPVDANEEDTLFEYLNLLVSRPDLRLALGNQARQWVQRECNWDRVAARYLDFLSAVSEGRSETEPEPAAAQEVRAVPVEPEYISGWTSSEDAKAYLGRHLTRFEKTLSITPAGGSNERILEMGAYMQITPALKTKLGYGEVRGCYYGRPGAVEHKRVVSADGDIFECDVDLFDAEKDTFPYPEEHFHTVLCCELLEHLASDPMHMMCEIHRILAPGGHLVLTTPNIASLRAIHAILEGYHPGFFPPYLRPREGEESAGARHNREYSPREIAMLMRDAGFELTLLDTGPFIEEPKPEHAWISHLLSHYKISAEHRSDGIYAVGRKAQPVRERYPAWLYS